MEKEQVKNIFEKYIKYAIKLTIKELGVEINDLPRVELVQELYDVYNEKPRFDIYINSNWFWEAHKNEEVFNSKIRELARMSRLVNSINYRIFYNTNIPERFDELLSSSEEFKTELENYLSGYDSKDSYFEVEFVGPENTNWVGMDKMTARVIVRLNTIEPNNDSLIKAAEKTLKIVLTRMVNNYDGFEGFLLYMDIEELENSVDNVDNDEELNENKVEDSISLIKKNTDRIKTTFKEELKNSSDDAKIAFKHLVTKKKNLSKEEREQISNELKLVFKRTAKRLGMAGLFMLPGGSILIVLLHLFTKKKEEPYDEIITEDSKIRIFSESVEDEELKWHRDREDRLVEVIEGDGWEIQFDNELPKKLTPGTQIVIPEGVYHRVIKGSSELKIKVHFLD